MYVYIKDNQIEAITPNQLNPRDGVVELDLPDDDIALTNDLQYLVYENGQVVRYEHSQDEFNTLYQQHRSDPAQYAIKRKLDYPSWQDQADMQYHDAVNGTTTWQDAIKAVKDANPKPDE